MEGELEGSGDGLAVKGGPGVHMVMIFIEKALWTSLTTLR